jgi:hypothetical protein
MYKILGADQNEYGPVSADELRKWIAEGRVVSNTLVRLDGTTEWKTAASLPELAALFTTAAAAAPASAPAKTSGLAIASLVLGLLGCTSLFGLICGIIALVKIGKSQGRLGGKGLAIAGVCISGFTMLLIVPVSAGLLLPALAQAKAKAQTVSCQANMKQLGLAVRIYATGNSDTLPKAENWCDAIMSTAGSPRIFICPAKQDGQRSHYAYNAKLSGKKDSEINPQTVMIFESSGGWNKSGGPESLATHHKMYSIGFADGSVQQVPASKLGTLRWDP